MTVHVHPPGTPRPVLRDRGGPFLVDGCDRCAEFVRDLGLHFDQGRFRAFWQKMIDVEFDHTGGYASQLDAALGRKLYMVALTIHRAFGVDPGSLASMATVMDGLPPEARTLVYPEGVQ